MKAQIIGGRLQITDGNYTGTFHMGTPGEVAAYAARCREEAERKIRMAERLEYAAVALQIDAQMAADRAAKQRRERSNATRAKRAEFRRTYGGS
jgi:hypothetical protein